MRLISNKHFVVLLVPLLVRNCSVAGATDGKTHPNFSVAGATDGKTHPNCSVTGATDGKTHHPRPLVTLTSISLIYDKSVTTQNLTFSSYWYRKKHLQMHFLTGIVS